ncbi:ParA family protein [Streptomyces sp. NRRL B-24484]|uniref:ParA family protein n=1 Tax=Streptomyces sp. NRRL B-24484 TaxID=1463833 RepID=UPI0004C22449|nr:ParA family protein [Streptomyces sp. NRRL B-24484]
MSTTPDASLQIPENTGRETRVIVAVNESGGSVKTTTVSALAAIAAEAGLQVLAIEADSQRDLSHILGYDDPDADDNIATLYDVVDGLAALDEAIIPARRGEGGPVIPNLWLVPGSRKLKNLEDLLATATLREMWLNRLMPSVVGRFDVIFIDCPGDLKLTTKGALVSSKEVEVMACVKSQLKEARALTELEATLDDINGAFAPFGVKLEVDWVVIGESVSDKSQGKVYEDAEAQLREAYGNLVLTPSVRRSTKVPEAYSAQVALPIYAPRSEPAVQYRGVAEGMGLTQAS